MCSSDLLEMRTQHRNIVGIDAVVLSRPFEADRGDGAGDGQARRAVRALVALAFHRCKGDRYRPTIASTSALRKRSTTSMKPIDGISSKSAVIDEI